MKSEQTSRHASRRGFEAFDPAQGGGLSDAQRDAIAQAIVAQGPALIRQGSAQRLLGKVALGGALAAAAAFAFMLQSQEAETKQELPALAVAPSCAADAQATPVTSDVEEGLSIAIGSRIRVATERATELSVVEAEPCVTRLALKEGTLTLQARDLGGGTLWVETPHGQVRAVGTFMRIVTLASSTTIRVVEGEVVMMRGLQNAESVGAGRAITIDGERVVRFELSGEERASLLGAFDEPVKTVEEPVPPAGPKPAVAARAPRPRATKPADQAQAQPAFSATALLTEAEALWRQGEHESARRAFRAAAQDKGAIGEAAWVRLARLELSAGSTERALTALQARRNRAGAGTLGAEALWLEVQVLERAGRSVDARQAAGDLLRDYPSSPQAPAARRLVEKGKVP